MNAKARKLKALLLVFVLFIHSAACAQTIDDKKAIEDPAEFANILIINKRFGQATEFTRWVLSDPALPAEKREILRYLLGLALAGLEDYKAAAEVFRGILDKDPTITQVRVALGRVLFLDGNDNAAKRQFDLVLADRAAAELMHEQARQHLAAIRARNGWRFATNFGFTENSNINAAPDEGAAVFIAGIPFSSNTKKERGWGAAFGFSANYRRQVAKQTQLEGGFSYSGGAFPGALDASTGVQFFVGPRFLYPNGSADFAVLASHNWSHGHPVSRGYGLRGNIERIIGSGWRTSMAMQYLLQENISTPDADAQVYYLQGRIDAGLSRVMNGNVNLSATKNDAKSARYSYTSIGGGIGLRRDFAWGITAGASFSVSRTSFDGITPLVGYRQKDVTKTMVLTLLKRDWRLFGFAPELSGISQRKKSNIAISSYDNYITQINFTKNF